ncbi:MAG: hypothetical protein U9R58_06420 [Chloroflexota bacterium]|nr:hypothetical protein [Chloroflexota bacterium]
MSVLPRLSSMQGRKDEELNKDLGRELVEKNDADGIREIAENLWNQDKQIQTDCLSVLEQVGLSAPELIEDYVSDLLQLIFCNDNRLVWAAMINLALVADRKPQEIFEQYDDIVKVIERGSVITKDNGIKTLARVAAANAEYNEVVFPYLVEQLKSCRSKSVSQYAESISVAVTTDNQEQYLEVLNERLDTLSASQQRRVKKLLRTFENG